MYFTSSNPRVIAGYFHQTVEHISGGPKIIRTDDGTENVVLWNIQRYLRRNGTDRFSGKLSARGGRSSANQRIGQLWGSLRKQCTQFWIELMKDMLNTGHFDGGFIDKNLIQFCFLNWIQVSFLLLLANSLQEHSLAFWSSRFFVCYWRIHTEFASILVGPACVCMFVCGQVLHLMRCRSSKSWDTHLFQGDLERWKVKVTEVKSLIFG